MATISSVSKTSCYFDEIQHKTFSNKTKQLRHTYRWVCSDYQATRALLFESFQLQSQNFTISNRTKNHFEHEAILRPFFPSAAKMHSLPLIKHSNHPSAASTSRETNITVRFELSEFDTVAQVYPELTTIGEVLDDVASKFQLMPKYLSIKHKFGSKIPKPARLIQLCTNNFRILDVQLCLSDLANHLNESIHNEHEKIHIDTNSYYR